MSDIRVVWSSLFMVSTKFNEDADNAVGRFCKEVYTTMKKNNAQVLAILCAGFKLDCVSHSFAMHASPKPKNETHANKYIVQPFLQEIYMHLLNIIKTWFLV